MKNTNYVGEVVEAVFGKKGVIRATKYVGPKQIIRVTPSKKEVGKRFQAVLTIGQPNYVEREFIKKFLKSGGVFPIGDVQLKFTKSKIKKITKK